MRMEKGGEGRGDGVGTGMAKYILKIMSPIGQIQALLVMDDGLTLANKPLPKIPVF